MSEEFKKENEYEMFPPSFGCDNCIHVIIKSNMGESGSNQLYCSIGKFFTLPDSICKKYKS